MKTARELKTITRTLSRGTTVADLIAELETLDPDAIVGFATDYGDYCHTQQFLPVEHIEEMAGENLKESAYSNSKIALTEDEDGEDTADMTLEERIEYRKQLEEQEELPRIVVLR